MDERSLSAIEPLKRILANQIIIIAGHYGVGKTNLSLNLACDAAALGRRATLIDLDVVNPYFRSSDYSGLLQKRGVEVISPVFAGTTLDNPSLSGSISRAIKDVKQQESGRDCLIIDAGGDDVGSTALGRFSNALTEQGYALFYVVNAFRNLTQEPLQAIELLYEIEIKSHLKATGIINNSHLQNETTDKTIEEGQVFAKSVADEVQLPLVCTTIPNTLVCPKSDSGNRENVYPIMRYVRTSWDI